MAVEGAVGQDHLHRLEHVLEHARGRDAVARAGGVDDHRHLAVSNTLRSCSRSASQLGLAGPCRLRNAAPRGGVALAAHQGFVRQQVVHAHARRGPCPRAALGVVALGDLHRAELADHHRLELLAGASSSGHAEAGDVGARAGDEQRRRHAAGQRLADHRARWGRTVSRVRISTLVGVTMSLMSPPPDADVVVQVDEARADVVVAVVEHLGVLGRDRDLRRRGRSRGSCRLLDPHRPAKRARPSPSADGGSGRRPARDRAQVVGGGQAACAAAPPAALQPRMESARVISASAALSDVRPSRVILAPDQKRGRPGRGGRRCGR